MSRERNSWNNRLSPLRIIGDKPPKSSPLGNDFSPRPLWGGTWPCIELWNKIWLSQASSLQASKTKTRKGQPTQMKDSLGKQEGHQSSTSRSNLLWWTVVESTNGIIPVGTWAPVNLFRLQKDPLVSLEFGNLRLVKIFLVVQSTGSRYQVGSCDWHGMGFDFGPMFHFHDSSIPTILSTSGL